MGLGNQCQRGRGSRPATVGALLFAILTLTAFHPTRAQTPPAPAGAHATLSPTEVQRALDLLQDPGKRDQLIDTLRTIAKVSSAPVAKAAPAAAASAKAADGVGADVLSEASSKIGELSAELGHTISSALEIPPTSARQVGSIITLMRIEARLPWRGRRIEFQIPTRRRPGR